MTNRIVVFSDIQGNSVALEAMFHWLEQLPDYESLDYICLGDLACGYAPNTVLDLLREHDVKCIRGNMDDVILNPRPLRADSEIGILFNEMDQWVSEQLTPMNRDTLANSQPNIKMQIKQQIFRFTHGSLQDNNQVLTAATPRLSAYFPVDTFALFTGHTHQPFMFPVEDKVLINPGSIGFPDALPQNGKRPLRAQFMLLDEGRFEFVTVNYKREDFSFVVMNSGMPHALWYLSLWDI